MQTSPSLRGIVEQKRKFYRLIRFSTRNRGQFKIHRGVTLSRVYKSIVHKEDSRCSTRSYTPVSSPHDVERTTCIQFDWSFQRVGGVPLCKLSVRTEIPSPSPSPTKQNNRHRLRSCRRALRMLMKFLFSFTSLFSPLFFFFFDFSFNSLRSVVATPSISSLNCSLLSTRFFALPSPSPRLFQLLFFERMPFSTPSKLFTSGLRYFQPSFLAWTARLGIFSTSIVLTWPLLYSSV